MQLPTKATPCRHRAALFVVALLRGLRRRNPLRAWGWGKIRLPRRRDWCLANSAKIDRYMSFTYPISRLEQRTLASYTQSGDCVRTGGKRAETMTRSARTATLVVLLCLPVLALSDLAAWAKHHRVGPYFSGPCPDRRKSTRLSICSACMGGIKTCAQQHVCSNNRSVVCGDESTVSVPCWNQRYRW